MLKAGRPKKNTQKREIRLPFEYVSLCAAFVDTWVNPEKLLLMFISHLKGCITTRIVPFVAYFYVLFPTNAVLPTVQTIFISSFTKKAH